MVNREKTIVNKQEIEYVDVSQMTKAEWEGFRSSLGTIGGSDIGTICGVNQWKDAIMLFYEKIGVKENTFKGNKYTTIGTFLEPSILDMFCYGDSLEEINLNHRKQQKIREAHDPLVTYFPKHMEWAHLNIDGLITRDNEYGYLGTGVAEIKKISGRASDKYIGGIPPSYLFQLQFYMWGLKAKYGYIAAFVGETDFFTRYYDLDEDILSIILDKVPRFVQAIEEGKKVMASKKKYPEKMKDIYMVEDTFSDVLQPVNWELLGKWLAEPVNIDLRVGSIPLEGDMQRIVEMAIHESNMEVAAKLAKQQYHTQIKKYMTEQEANVMENEEYIVKFQKRLSIKKYD